MSWISISGIFVIVWWIVLFTLLPLWVKKAVPEKGIPGGVPENPYIGRKMILATLISILLTLIITLLFNYQIFNFNFVYRK